MSELAGRRVLVVGLGVSGFAAARALADLGAVVRVTESSSGEAVLERAAALRRSGIEVEVGGHDTAALDADVAVLSPGIPPTAPVVRALEGRGTRTISEVELAYRLARCDFIAVTGTNGKTTTTSLLASMLQEGGLACVAAGNIGLPLVEAVASVPDDGVIAVEVSSFQLAAIETFRPRVGVLLNVAEDHIDWHGALESYVAAKARLVANQEAGDVFIPNAEDERAMEIAASAAARLAPFSSRRAPADGIGIDGELAVWRGRPVFSEADVPLAGRAGLEDALAAAGAALEYGVEPGAVMRALKGFRPLPHRMEVVAAAGGVAYIDDSKATNPHATLGAVKGLSDVVLIAGGRSKGIDLRPLAGTVPPVRAVVALGEAGDAIHEVFDALVPVDRAGSMDEAVRLARARVPAGGTVPLSPACASLDMYASYSERGEDFARSVRSLLENEIEEGGHGNS